MPGALPKNSSVFVMKMFGPTGYTVINLTQNNLACVKRCGAIVLHALPTQNHLATREATVIHYHASQIEQILLVPQLISLGLCRPASLHLRARQSFVVMSEDHQRFQMGLRIAHRPSDNSSVRTAPTPTSDLALLPRALEVMLSTAVINTIPVVSILVTVVDKTPLTERAL